MIRITSEFGELGLEFTLHLCERRQLSLDSSEPLFVQGAGFLASGVMVEVLLVEARVESANVLSFEARVEEHADVVDASDGRIFILTIPVVLATGLEQTALFVVAESPRRNPSHVGKFPNPHCAPFPMSVMIRTMPVSQVAGQQPEFA